MVTLFHTLFFDPLYNILIGIYEILPWKDFGVAIILITVLIKWLLAPIFRKQIESQKKLQELQPKIKALQEKHKDNKEAQTKAVMAFYKENDVNPFAGCLPLIIQLIIFLAIYRVLILLGQDDFVINNDILYSFISNPGVVKTLSLGVIDLTQPHYILAILAAGAMYIQSKMMMQKNITNNKKKEKKEGGAPDFSQIMMKQMLYIGPVITLVIGFQFEAGLTLYLFTSILFSIVQQYLIGRKKKVQEPASGATPA